MKEKIFPLQPIVLYDQVERPIDWSREFHAPAPLDVEIGFGNGEFLVRTAKENPGRHFVGIEQHWERTYKTLGRIAREDIANVRVLLVDAALAFERLFSPLTIDNIYCLFPCPWPKKRHVSHRLFSREFLRLLNSRLVKKGQLKIVTDFLPYRDWILEQIERTGFSKETKEIQPQYGTKFERKWLEEGQKEFYQLRLIKERHIRVPLKEDVQLRTYSLDNFNAQNFTMEDDRDGEEKVIFKEFLYDGKREKAMVYLVVAEKDLTQHLWVAIAHGSDRWYVCPAEGNRFI
ncbi:MAG: tRNA (guanosine(46)-N7)-methyltransferase TrmB, partial [Candidatus Omnitrophota bacterium]